MTNKVTIENIGGKDYTIVWHEKTYEGEILSREKIYNGFQYMVQRPPVSGCIPAKVHIATALKPLPRKPKPEDAPLLYRYMAEGIVLTMFLSSPYTVKEYQSDDYLFWVEFGQRGMPITHATYNGEKVEVAIDD